MRLLKKTAIALVALLLFASLGCSKSAAQRVKSAAENMDKATSWEAKATLVMSMNVTESNKTLPLSVSINADLSYFKQPMAIKAIITAIVPDQDQMSLELYSETTADNMMKLYLKESGKWTTQVLPLGTLTGAQTKKIDGMSLFKAINIVGSDTINGVLADKIDCVIDEEKLYSTIMQASGAGLLLGQDAQLQAQLQAVKNAMKGLTLQYWVAKNEDRIVQIKVDMTKFVQAILTMAKADMGDILKGIGGTDGNQIPSSTDAAVSEMYILLTFDKFNSATPIVIPDDARTTVTR